LLLALALVACTPVPGYTVRPERLVDAASYRGTYWRAHGFAGEWQSITIAAVDGVPVMPPLLRSSETDVRPIESGSHRVVLACDGYEDHVSWYAHAAVDAVLLPRTAYVVKGQVAVDKVVLWIERDDDAEPVTAPVAVMRFPKPRAGTSYRPVTLPR
jgi:hypothetical protein